MDWTEPNVKFQKIFIKINSNILTSYITSITTKQKIVLFCTKYFYFFLHINQICYSTSLLPQVQSITKHSQKACLKKNILVLYKKIKITFNGSKKSKITKTHF